jgi:O-antigen biosynthesis protein WbqP
LAEILAELIKRIFDITLSMSLIGILAIPMVVIGLIVKSTSPGPVLFWSSRIGIHNGIFRMPKFRTMHINTPNVATHLLEDPDSHLTSIGRFLRRSSLDELPQLFSVLKGDMSLVGPRPALYNQFDLIALRTEKGVHRIHPGITGWAQVNGRDDLPIPRKVEYDAYYLAHRSIAFDLLTIMRTIASVFRREGINH